MSINTYIVLLYLLLSTGCHKGLLDKDPSSANIEPSTVEDCWSLLDNENTMDCSPAILEASADDYYFTTDYWLSRPVVERNVYIWAKDIFNGSGNSYDYNIPYKQVLSCNVVLEALVAMSPDTPEWREVKGTALFKRAFAFYNLAQLFAPVYDSSNFHIALGIPLRYSADVSLPSIRSTVYDTYQQIINDLETAASLLTQAVPDDYRNRPCRTAIYALQSRVFLSMRLYQKAGTAADSALYHYNQCIDYNDVNKNSNMPFQVRNVENLYNARIPNSAFQSIQPFLGAANIDTTLYRSYGPNDLRKSIFFSITTGQPRRKNFYDGQGATLYTGLATDELYLTRAECYARESQKDSAMAWLNRLLIYRTTRDSFTAYTATDATDALQQVLTERRKELVMRGLRWTDLRRLNKEGYNITPKRNINGVAYLLPPNSPLYTLPLPPDVIALTGMPQNER